MHDVAKLVHTNTKWDVVYQNFRQFVDNQKGVSFGYDVVLIDALSTSLFICSDGEYGKGAQDLAILGAAQFVN